MAAEAPKQEKKPEAPAKAEAPEKKPEKKHEKYEKKDKPVTKEDRIANRVRVSGVILDGNLEVTLAITGIKGVGARIAKQLGFILGYKKGTKLSSLNEQQIEELEKAILEVDKKLPHWMVNRQKDILTGKNVHLTGPELDITKRGDIDMHKKIRTYRGVRHSLNQPVRGQRTRSSFRTGATLGVVRKKEVPAAAGDKKEKK